MILPSILVLNLLVACTFSWRSADQADEVARIAAAYHSWTQVYDQPKLVSVDLMMLCRMVSDEEVIARDGPHARRTIQVYVNSVGEKAMQAGEGRVFPVGAVIVKEKDVANDIATEAATPTPAPTQRPLGIMIKREAGFNPSGDDWEYIYWEPPSAPLRGSQIAHCQSCHIKHQASDSVFADVNRP